MLVATLVGCEEVSVTPDQDPPDTLITSQHGATTIFAHIEFTFVGSEPSSFQCSLDGSAFAACTSPHALTGLADGDHVFQVRAVDEAGNVDLTPAEVAWNIDTTSAGIEFLTAPEATTNARSADITFATNRPATFLCYLDETLVACMPTADHLGGSFTSAELLDGAHEFRVDATVTGSGEEITNSTTWMLDATGPSVTFLSPANNGATNAATINVTYEVDEAATLTCTKDGVGVPCGTVPTLPGTVTTPLGALSQTSNVTFRVTATDALGNAATATLMFAVDRTKPNVTFGTETASTIPFSSNEQVTFYCTLVQLPNDVVVDEVVCNAATPPGTSGIFGKNVGGGISHRLDVFAIDRAGNASNTVSKTFCGMSIIPC